MMDSGITKKHMEEDLIRRAWESEEFKQKLLINPRDVLQELGYQISHDIEISIQEEHKNKMILVLPSNPLTNMNEMISGVTPPGGPNPLATYNCREPDQGPRPGKAPDPFTMVHCIDTPPSPPPKPSPRPETPENPQK